jgi:hypothetical protein
MSVLSVSMSPAERRRAREFAELLEGSRPAAGHELESLVALASTLVPEQFTPRAEFRAALRESLVAEATARRPAMIPSQATAGPPEQRHRVRRIVATGLLVSLVGGVGAAAASTHALPGDPLYGLKRGIESAQLRFAHSDLARGRELLEQADHRLSEVEALAASDDARSPETTDRIAQTIADLDSATQAGTDALNAAYAKTGDVEPLIELHRFVVDQRERLADLSTLLGPDMRALLAPLSERLIALQAHLDTLIQGPSASPVPTGTAAPGSGGRVGGTDVTGTIGGLTGGGAPTVDPGGGTGAGGALGNGGSASTMPSAVPHVSVPGPVVPSVPLPTPPLPTPTLPAPLPTLPPVNVTPPVCVPIPPLTTC